MNVEHEHSHCRRETGIWDSRFTLKGATATYAPDRTFDTEHIRLEIRIDINRETLTGLCRTRLRAIAPGAREMVFDAVNFKIDKVQWNGRTVPYTYKDGQIRVAAPAPLAAGREATVDIAYRVVRPKLGLYFIRPNRFYPTSPTQVWTQGEDEYARYWFPCHDAPHDRASTEVIATVPAGFTAVSNGRFVRATHDRRKKLSTYHWRQDIPHATYLVTLTVGRFSTLTDSWRGMPVTYYCEKGREEDTRRAFGKTPRMLDFFSRFIGVKYPYAKYAQIAAADFIYGGMENTSATTQTDTALLDERVSIDYSSDELVAHELAHQWFGDYLTCKDWSHAWLNESFATYFDALFKRHDKGQDEFLYAIRNNADAYFQEDKEHYRRPIMTKVFKRPTDLFDRHLYEKGSVVLFMLHNLLGEQMFRKSIRTYVQKNRGRVVETVDLVNAIEEATGRNLRRFFDQWILGAGHPEFKVRAWWDARKKQMSVRVAQTQAVGGEVSLFKIETELLFRTGGTERREKIVIDGKSHLFEFRLTSEPDLILFDPDQVILKKVDFPKTEAMWLVQIAKDKNPLGRIDAAYALARIGSRAALRALRQALLSDPFWAVQAETARALGSMASEEAATLLLHSLDVVESPKVRRSVYGALRGFKSQKTAVEVAARFRKEASYFAEAEGYRVVGALRHPKAADILAEGLKKDSWNDVLRTAALEGMAALRSEETLPLLLEHSRQGHHQRLRMAAIRCLAQLEPGTPGVQNRLIECANDPFLLVQISAVRALHQVADERALPVLRKLTEGDRDGRLKRLAEEAIEKISKGVEPAKKSS